MTTTAERTLVGLIHALERGDRAALQAAFAEDVQLRASLPGGDVRRFGPAESAALMLSWFADSTNIVRVNSGVDPVGDVWHVGYRFTLCEAGADLVVEQHACCTMAAGRIAAIRIMCSGFRPIDGDARPGGAGGAHAAAAADAHLNALGEGCATLTPRIATTMRTMRPGEVLAVLTDDPAAADGIAAWSRMTGHEIVATSPESRGTRYFLKRA
jgi:TusA-related sulfurtransferase/ketosteroid isomerase-like protein